MTVEELQHIIHTREKRTLEFKRAWSEVPSNLFETICAFLNRDGGTIILGAEDDGHVERGINPAALEQISKNISNLSNNPQKLYPPFLLQPDPINIDGKIVLVLSIPSSSQVHKTAGKVFDRSNDGDYELKTDAELSFIPPNAEIHDWPTFESKSTKYALADYIVGWLNFFANIKGIKPINKFIDFIRNQFYRPQYLKDCINFINQYDTIYSTRLHIAVASAMMGKTVHLIDNSYGKNYNFFDTWLSNVENVKRK